MAEVKWRRLKLTEVAEDSGDFTSVHLCMMGCSHLKTMQTDEILDWLTTAEILAMALKTNNSVAPTKRAFITCTLYKYQITLVCMVCHLFHTVM
jgi:hypothetical protein